MGFLAVMTGIQYAIGAMAMLEQAWPQQGLGKTKKEVLMNGLHVVLNAAVAETGALVQAGSNTKINSEINAAAQLVSMFVDNTVGLLKKAGVFHGGDPTSPQPPTAGSGTPPTSSGPVATPGTSPQPTVNTPPVVGPATPGLPPAAQPNQRT
jgi:hypothetical protein